MATAAGSPIQAPARRVVLAHESAIALGPLRVVPALRQIVHADGRDEIVEPKVMEVLVVLLRANGGILTRDELCAAAWDGRIVGDDAINRVLSRLRRLSEGIGAGTFTVETITKVGYRLNTAAPVAVPAIAGPAAGGDGEAAAAAASVGGAATAPAPAGRRPTLAILPFASRSGIAADEQFGADLVEDVTAALSLGRGLRVLASGTTATYGARGIDARRISSELDTDYVFEGNVRRLGNGRRVTVQLVDGRSGAILWTGKFDRPLADDAGAQEALVADVAGHLGVQIQHIEMDRATKKAGELTAWEAVRRSWATIPKLTPEGLQASIDAARTAVALAPNYAIAASTLALCLGVLYQVNGSLEPDLLAEALRHADRALELDRNHGTVLFQVSLVKSYAQEWQESLDHVERSVELNPNMPEAHQTLGGIYTRYERYDEALAAFDIADQLAPRGFTAAITLMNRCWALYGAGRVDEALVAADRILVINPGDRAGLRLRLVFHAELGNDALARADMAELRRVSPGIPREVFTGTIAASRQADVPRARNLELFERVWDETPFD
jgi:TolB-like protein/DNA-binding winged helix-turn-helix (wHTH) protein/tetratricopeptide (TPR) repeat protein